MYIIDKTSLLSLYSCYSKYAVYGSTAGTSTWWNNGYWLSDDCCAMALQAVSCYWYTKIIGPLSRAQMIFLSDCPIVLQQPVGPVPSTVLYHVLTLVSYQVWYDTLDVQWWLVPGTSRYSCAQQSSHIRALLIARTVEPFTKYIRPTKNSTRQTVGFPTWGHCHHRKDPLFDHSWNEKVIELTFFCLSSLVEHIARNDLDQATYIWIEVAVVPFLTSGRQCFCYFLCNQQWWFQSICNLTHQNGSLERNEIIGAIVSG